MKTTYTALLLLVVLFLMAPVVSGDGSGCEIISFSQYEKLSGHGFAVSCVNLTIRNNDSVERTLINTGIVAVTVDGKRRSPKGFMTKIEPGGIYQGTICFGEQLRTITKLECKFHEEGF